MYCEEKELWVKGTASAKDLEKATLDSGGKPVWLKYTA